MMPASNGERGVRFRRVASPLGDLLLVADVTKGFVLRGLYFYDAPHAESAIPRGAREDAGVFDGIVRQLEAYFAGRRTTFDVPLELVGTPFQRAVWRALLRIPYGTTTTYAAIARAIGRPEAVRAVGAANGKNPIAIVVPCHRVIASDGALTGYAGGLAAKRALLELEARSAGGSHRKRGRAEGEGD